MLNHSSCYGSQRLLTALTVIHAQCRHCQRLRSHLGEAYGDCRADVCTISFKYFTLTDLTTHEKINFSEQQVTFQP